LLIVQLNVSDLFFFRRSRPPSRPQESPVRLLRTRIWLTAAADDALFEFVRLVRATPEFLAAALNVVQRDFVPQRSSTEEMIGT
jgi:hypothetical protein